MKTGSSPANLPEESVRKRPRLISNNVNSLSYVPKKDQSQKVADAKNENGKAPSPSKPTQTGNESKKTFALTANNGKNVSSNTWAVIGTRLKHKADDSRKEKRVTTYTNAIYYCASLLAYWTWCNHQVDLI